jgi:hypothetical protein
LLRKSVALYRGMGRPVAVRSDSATKLELANGSRVFALPGDPAGIVGFTPALIVIDEAARVQDELYLSVRPMLAVSKGRLMGFSTPFGCRGWFYTAYQSREQWERVTITASECPRIDPAFLKSEREALGDRWWRQEYDCSFEADTGAVFTVEEIMAAGVEEAPDWLGA